MRELVINAVTFNDIAREVREHGGRAVLMHPRNRDEALLVTAGRAVVPIHAPKRKPVGTRQRNQLAKGWRRQTARTVPPVLLGGYGYAEGEKPKRSYRERHRRAGEGDVR